MAKNLQPDRLASSELNQAVESPRLPISFGWFLLLATAYVLPGLIGHDPWKQDETYVFDILYRMLQNHDWVVPHLAGEPFMEKPPLYYWLGAALAHSFSGWLPLHDGARLATGVFMAITFLFAGLTARHAWGTGHGRYAVLVLMSCFGLLYESHIMITDVPMLAGFSIASYGFILSRARPLAAGIWLGVGVGVGFLGKGVLVPGAVGVTALLLPLLFQNWRSKTYAHSLGVAFVVALPWLLIWPIALYLRDPHQFYVWFWLNNVGRYLGFSVAELGAPNNEPWSWLKTLLWFAFPALFLALASVWQRRHDIRRSAPLQLGLVSFGVYLAVLLTSASARASYGLPMLVALALLAAPQAATLPAALSRWLDWGARLFFGTLAALFWGVWGSMIATGHAPHWTFLTRVLPVDFVMPFLPLAVAVAAVATLVWLAAWYGLPRLYERSIVSFVAGLTLCWVLFATLWLPWLDNAKSYRSVFVAMQPNLPVQRNCVESIGLGESERGMLDYFLGVQTLRREIHPDIDCDVVLVEGSADTPPGLLAPAWRQVWQGGRPGDNKGRLWLFVR
ncbi:hypothetical protein TPL01_21750 [Sulfuriferula plumbiphila]|uniref:Glycosyltransferase RgtA/B/C/D-like domain-containing protein n=1 Tax=Sulfuriferula plumbiphila TaxID=171865 RepID=A0A512L996_9PROT|nr:glycosyltransferase family 39 protein [Sulfuriferula plumbiphila]BBP03041.1 glycosyl transferase [Sulfuriferula plumbiphila]GEP31037.1 hypothetical protein TPL01_21750 [Sulfuriferula plumbiphila]